MSASEVTYPEAGEALEILLVTARVTRRALYDLPAQICFDLNLSPAHELALREIILDTINKIADAGDEQIAQLVRLNRLEIEAAIANYQSRVKRDSEDFFRELDDSARAILQGETP
jgi:hypothetical protein